MLYLYSFVGERLPNEVSIICSRVQRSSTREIVAFTTRKITLNGITIIKKFLSEGMFIYLLLLSKTSIESCHVKFVCNFLVRGSLSDFSIFHSSVLIFSSLFLQSKLRTCILLQLRSCARDTFEVRVEITNKSF